MNPRYYEIDVSVAILYPDTIAQWDWSKNNSIDPFHLAPYSQIRVSWKCSVAPDHVWISSVCKQVETSGKGCPFCAGKRVSITNSLLSLYPTIAEQWDYSKNGGLTPDSIVAGSGKLIHWKCQVASDHKWVKTPSGRIHGEITAKY